MMTWNRRKRVGSACGSSRSVNQRAAIHRVDADELRKEIGALGNLEAADAAVVLAFPTDFARAGVELARDEEGRHGVDEAFPRDDAGMR